VTEEFIELGTGAESIGIGFSDQKNQRLGRVGKLLRLLAMASLGRTAQEATAATPAECNNKNGPLAQ
jgi:hypothetical protein